MSGYKGTIRIDFGPMKPLGETMLPVERNGVNGLECRMETLTFGRITAEAFDDNAILDIMDASDAGESFHPVISIVSKSQKSGFLYTVTGEKPGNGLLGDPIRAFGAGSKLYKALAFHGTVISANRRQAADYPPLLVIESMACGIKIVSAIKFSLSTQEMRQLTALALSGCAPWVKISGFGDINFVKIDGKPEYRVYINSMQHFNMTSDQPVNFGSADPKELARRMRDRENSFSGKGKRA